MENPDRAGSVLLLTTDASLERLILAETVSLGLRLSIAHSVSAALSLPGDLLLVLRDLDSVPGPSTDFPASLPVIGITRHEEALAPESASTVMWLWHRPFPIEQLHTELLHHLQAGKTTAISPTPARRRSIFSIHMDTDGKTLCVGEHRIGLTEKETIVMSCLLEHRGDTVSRETLLAALGNDGAIDAAEGTSNKLEVYMCYLRRKLEQPLGLRLITTVRGKGYRLEMTVPQLK